MKLRVLNIEIKPVLVWDDGENITPGPEMTTGTITLNQLGDDLQSAIKQVIKETEEQRAKEEAEQTEEQSADQINE